jgi:hypothetical protein
VNTETAALHVNDPPFPQVIEGFTDEDDKSGEVAWVVPDALPAGSYYFRAYSRESPIIFGFSAKFDVISE